jgi:hypothetical protein
MIHNSSIVDYNNNYNNHTEYFRIEAELKKARQKNSPWSIVYYTTRGYSESDGYKKIEELMMKKKKHIPASSLAHWISKGYTEDEANIQRKNYIQRIGAIPSLIDLIDKFGLELGSIKWKEYKQSIANRGNKEIENLMKNEGLCAKAAKVKRCRRRGTKRKEKLFPWRSYGDYCATVFYLTNLTMAQFDDMIDEKPRPDGHDLDHMYSKYGGWRNKISPHVIASIYNLTWLDHIENVSKGQYCSISLEELLEKYNTNTFGELRENNKIWAEVYEIINEET